jgi:hypothetical protein
MTGLPDDRMTSGHVANIGAGGARRRRIGGVVWVVVTVLVFGVLLATHQSKAMRLVVFVPAFLAALGFFQARAMTCVFLCVVGARERDAGDAKLSAEERAAVWRQSAGVALRSLLAAALAAAVAYFV